METFKEDIMKKNAFTLAEVLITLWIIGIVATMTLPALIAKHEKIETVTRLKRAYSLMNQGLFRAISDMGDVSDWPATIQSDVLISKYFAPYFKVLKLYPRADSWQYAMCYDGRTTVTATGVVTQYEWIDGVHISSPFLADVTSSMKLADEMCIGLNGIGVAYGGAQFFIDVNGSAKGPNKAGYDLFFFMIDKNSIKPYGWDWSHEELIDSGKQNACNLKAKYGGEVCAARIMSEGWQINYR